MIQRLLALVWLGSLSGCIAPQGEVPHVRIGLDAATQFNRRGMPQNERGVLQGDVDVDIRTKDGGTASVGAWGNMDLTSTTGNAWLPDGHAGQFSQIDLTASYSRSVDRFDLAIGAVSYNPTSGATFPFGPRGPTTELFVSASTELVSLEPSIAVHYDGDQVGGFYVNGAIGKSFELVEDLFLDGRLSLGYSDRNHSQWAYFVRQAGFADLQGAIDLSYRLDSSTWLTCGVTASTMIDDGIRTWMHGRGIDADTVWARVGIVWMLPGKY